MTTLNFHSPARLYLGPNRETALSQGAKSFRSAAEAIRFAIEEAAPVSLHGALLVVGNDAWSGPQIKIQYTSARYPLKRKSEIEREFS